MEWTLLGRRGEDDGIEGLHGHFHKDVGPEALLHCH